MCDNKPMAPYAKLPELEEYKEWFKDFADLYREDGILQVTWKTKMCIRDRLWQHVQISPSYSATCTAT